MKNKPNRPFFLMMLFYLLISIPAAAQWQGQFLFQALFLTKQANIHVPFMDS